MDRERHERDEDGDEQARLWAIVRQRPQHVSFATARESLILHYTPLVRYVAYRVAARLGYSVPREDLISFGMFGLIDAVDRFDPEFGVKFESYASVRIQGSIIDELRALDWAPRSVRSRAREVTSAEQALEQRLHRAPTPTEVAAELNWPVEDVHAANADTDNAYLDRLPDGSLDEEDGRRGALALTDNGAEEQVLSAEVALTRDALAKALARLPEGQRAVAYMYWAADLTLAQIGEVLGVSESWVCQVYTSAALTLREQLPYLR